MSIKLFCIGILLATLGNTAYSSPKSICETYQQLTSGEENSPKIKVERSVEVFSEEAKLVEMDKAMILATMLAENASKLLTVEKAIELFADKEFDGASGGSLTYSNFKYLSSKATVVRVTYYPGDNEYGSLFLVDKQGDMSFVSLIGQIQDGDVVCLK